MKKTFLFFVLMLTMSTSCIASPNGNGGDSLPLTIKTTNPSGQQNPFPKSPILAPTVYLDGHTLSFDEALEGCTIQLLDEGEVVVFSDFIEENQTSLVLPTSLIGEYELQIVCGGITFYCYIEL